MKQYNVGGMSCAACQARVEKAVSKVPGVTSCAVSLLTGSMGVEGSAADAAVIEAVVSAGYTASVKDRTAADPEDGLEDRETPVLRRRLISSLVFLAALMYISMGHTMWGLPLPRFFDGNHTAVGMAEMLLAIAVMVINKRFFVSGFKSALHGSPNMDTLVALGSAASFAWSVYALFRTTGASGSEAASWMHQLYFESAAMILTLITVGKLLEARSKGRTTDALKALIKLAPKTAAVIRDGKETVIGIDELRVGDIFAVRPGESIPADGTVISGETAVNESALTGESIPVDRSPGDGVSAATVNITGYITCRADRVGSDTALMQIIKTVSDAAATKAPIAKLADKAAGVFVPAVTAIAAITLIVWLLIGKTFGFALARAVSVLVISCPCSLGLATPVAVMVGSGVGARHGILFKTAASLEQTGKCGIVVLDKTGTVTMGEPEAVSVVPFDGVTEDELLRAARTVEEKSEHPLAKAVVREAEHRGISACEASGFRTLPGSGVTAVSEGSTITGGSAGFIASVTGRNDILPPAGEAAERGMTPLLFAKDGVPLGMICAADRIKPESTQAVKELKDLGISVVMLTGDNAKTAKAVGEIAGIDHVAAGVMPDGKADVIKRLGTLGKVIMAGDGINDAPALTMADTGIAIGAGTDIAIDAADVVLMNSRLTDVPTAIRLSRAVLTNIRENLFWAFFYNAVCIPLAAGCWTALLGWQMNPMIGAAAMSLSSFTVVSNALRLNLFDMNRHKKTRLSKRAVNDEDVKAVIDEINSGKEEKHMTVTMKIEGMMCPHCEARVKKALEAVPGVESAVPSFKTGTAVVTLGSEVGADALKAAVEAQDYTVLGIE